MSQTSYERVKIPSSVADHETKSFRAAFASHFHALKKKQGAEIVKIGRDRSYDDHVLSVRVRGLPNSKQARYLNSFRP